MVTFRGAGAALLAAEVVVGRFDGRAGVTAAPEFRFERGWSAIEEPYVRSWRHPPQTEKFLGIRPGQVSHAGPSAIRHE